MKKVLIAAAASLFVLAGCSSGPDDETTMSELKNDVNALSEQVAELKNMTVQSEMASDVAAAAALSAQEEAERANDRIDNIAQSYTK